MAGADPISLAASATQTGLGAAEAAIGLLEAGKAKREAARLAGLRPKYTASPLAAEGLSLAESDLAKGMSSQATAAYDALTNKQFSSSLDAILRGGGSVNNIGDVFGASGEGRQRLALMKDELRLKQIDNVVRASQRQQEEEEKAWQINLLDPWKDKAAANALARQGAANMIMSGINTAGSGAMNAFAPKYPNVGNSSGGGAGAGAAGAMGGAGGGGMNPEGIDWESFLSGG